MPNPSNAIFQFQGVYTNNGGGGGGVGVLAVGEQPHTLLKGWTINSTVTLTNNEATITLPKTQKKFRVMGLRAIAQDTSTTVYVLYNDTTIGIITQTTPTAGDVTEASSIVAAYSTLNPGDTLKLLVSRIGATSAPISVLITVVPVENT